MLVYIACIDYYFDKLYVSLHADPSDFVTDFPVGLSVTSSTQTPCFTLIVEDDDIAEETEDLTLRLSVVEPTAGQVTIEPSQLTVTITDNDLGKSSYSIRQSVD